MRDLAASHSSIFSESSTGFLAQNCSVVFITLVLLSLTNLCRRLNHSLNFSDLLTSILSSPSLATNTVRYPLLSTMAKDCISLSRI